MTEAFETVLAEPSLTPLLRTFDFLACCDVVANMRIVLANCHVRTVLASCHVETWLCEGREYVCFT